MNTLPTNDQILDKLRECRDPEIPCNIVDLGLVYDLRTKTTDAGHSTVEVTMTLTSRECPLYRQITENVHQKLLEIPGVSDARVQLVFDPSWDSTRITEDGRRQLGMI
jgi:metal-sulfur cluster biosynthetic enzyme